LLSDLSYTPLSHEWGKCCRMGAMNVTVAGQYLSRYLSISDVTTDPGYSTRYLSALNVGNDTVGRDLHYPIETATSNGLAVANFPVAATIRPEIILTGYARGSFGERVLPVVNQEEHLRLGLRNNDSVYRRPPRYLIVRPKTNQIEVYPNAVAGYTYDITYTGVSRANALSLPGDLIMSGDGDAFHYLVPMWAAIEIMTQDNRSEEMSSLVRRYVDGVVQAIHELHPASKLSDHLERMIYAKLGGMLPKEKP